MKPDEKVLIVEDEHEWRGIYARAVSAQSKVIKEAAELASAERLIDAIKFAVAFVDVCLDTLDDRNVDGLHVMEKIRTMGDETSIVMITGRSGQDVLSITRDAIKKYAAYDTFGKSSIRPSDISRLLDGGLQEYRRATQTGRTAAREALRGPVDALYWDDQVMRATGFVGHAGNFHDFLNELCGEYLPIVPGFDGEAAHIDDASGLVCGSYWSRGAGAPVLVCLGAAARFDEVIDLSQTQSALPGRYGRGTPIKQLSRHGVKASIFLLPKPSAPVVRPERHVEVRRH